jgi:hypothetical protein
MRVDSTGGYLESNFEDRHAMRPVSWRVTNPILHIAAKLLWTVVAKAKEAVNEGGGNHSRRTNSDSHRRMDYTSKIYFAMRRVDWRIMQKNFKNSLLDSSARRGSDRRPTGTCKSTSTSRCHRVSDCTITWMIILYSAVTQLTLNVEQLD